MKIILSLLLLCILFFGCKKEEVCGCATPYQIYYLRATIIQVSDVACYLPVLDFSEDSLRIRNITGGNSLQFSVINLPSASIVINKKLYVSVAILKPVEEFQCNTLGFGYPHLKIEDAKNRD